MNAFISIIEALDELLKSRGFKRTRFPPGGPRDWRRLGKRLYHNRHTSVVVVPAIEVFPCGPRLSRPMPPRLGRNLRPVSIDQFFAEVLRDLLETGARNVIFQGGGTIRIPDWFREKCAEFGIRIEVIGHEQEPELKVFSPDRAPDFSGANVPDFSGHQLHI